MKSTVIKTIITINNNNNNNNNVVLTDFNKAVESVFSFSVNWVINTLLTKLNCVSRMLWGVL